MSESSQNPPRPEEKDTPLGLALSDCQDRLDVQGRLVRRHFWRRLLPGIGITSYAAVTVALGAGTPVVMVMAISGLFTVREALVFRRNLSRLRDTEVELAELTSSSGGDSSAEGSVVRAEDG